MGVPTGILMAGGKLKPAVSAGKRIGPAGPGSGLPGRRTRQIQGLTARMQKNHTVSAFGVDHVISKASLLGAGSALSHGVGAGGMSAKKLGAAMGPAKVPSKLGYGAGRQAAQQQGRRAAREFAAGRTSPAGQGMYSANTGWQAKAGAVRNLPAGRPSPAGMRGPIQSRVKTSRMRANERNFL